MSSTLNCSIAPCKSCPYRKDAKLAHWCRSHYVELLINESQQFGPLYQCHKKNGKMCTGWVMNQVDQGLPSISLRIHFSREGVTNAMVDALRCLSPRYDSVLEMAVANYPDLASWPLVPGIEKERSQADQNS